MQPLIGKGGGVDVLVAGGGVAGTAAAVSAARAGCRAVLVEQGNILGGIGTRGMLRTICGLYVNGASEQAETLNAGLTRETVVALGKRAPQRKVAKAGKVFVLPYDSADLAAVLDACCSSERSLTVRLGAQVISSDVEGGRIAEVVVRSLEAEERIRPRAVIDCTGSGEFSALSGAGYDLSSPEERQLDGFTVRVTGIETGDEALAIKVPYAMATSPLRFTTFVSGDTAGEGFLKFSAGVSGRDVEQEVGVAFRLLTEKLPAFRNAVIAERSGLLEREGRRVRGEYVLTEEDVLAARKFPDGVVKNAWPIEFWDRIKGALYQYVPAGEYYEIPFRCLTVKGFSNLLVAGRCISATREAIASARVMGACMAMGDIAGQAAAGLVKSGKYPAFRK